MKPVRTDPDREALPDGHRCQDRGVPIDRLHQQGPDQWASAFREGWRQSPATTATC